MGNFSASGSEGSVVGRGWRFAMLDDPDCLIPDHLAPYLQLWSDGTYKVGNYGSLSIPVNTYTMVTVSSDGTGTIAGIKLYANGSLDAIGSQYTSDVVDNLQGHSIVATTNTWLGDLQHFTNPDNSDPPANHYRFKGKITKLGVWNRVLTPDEISGIYARDKNALPPSLGSITSSYGMKSDVDTISLLQDLVSSNVCTTTGLSFVWQ